MRKKEILISKVFARYKRGLGEEKNAAKEILLKMGVNIEELEVQEEDRDTKYRLQVGKNYRLLFWQTLAYFTEKILGIDNIFYYLIYRYGKNKEKTQVIMNCNDTRYNEWKAGEIGYIDGYIYDNNLGQRVIVKNMEGNRGKSGNGAIWKYRALNSDYYLFKHEYILVFKK